MFQELASLCSCFVTPGWRRTAWSFWTYGLRGDICTATHCEAWMHQEVLEQKILQESNNFTRKTFSVKTKKMTAILRKKNEERHGFIMFHINFPKRTNPMTFVSHSPPASRMCLVACGCPGHGADCVVPRSAVGGMRLFRIGEMDINVP